MDRRKLLIAIYASMLCAGMIAIATRGQEKGTQEKGIPGNVTTIEGWVIDSSCAFTKGLKKPISEKCAQDCAKAGSPLVILADKGAIYWPISGTVPATGQNDRLLEFAGKRVSVTGKVYTKGGSRAMVIEKIEAATRPMK